MRVFVAGATGVVGRRIVGLLAADGHHVTAMSRNPARLEPAGASNVELVAGDMLDRDSVMRVVTRASPEVVIHQATSLSTMKDLRRFDEELASTNRLRTEGTDHLLEAALATGARRFIAQSFTNWTNAREGSPTKTEEDPLDTSPPRGQRLSLDAIRHLEHVVVQATGIEGLALRYGNLYGPGTALALGGQMVAAARKRALPIVGDGAGVWSFVHVEDAAQATVLALTRGVPGTYNVTDDEPATVSTWLPRLAFVLGAKPPRRIPAWVARMFIGEVGVSMMTRIRGSSNAKAKRELGWRLTYPSWRAGFMRELAGTDFEGR
jgi:nucleoside-diphosphate-sugar epimerase